MADLEKKDAECDLEILIPIGPSSGCPDLLSLKQFLIALVTYKMQHYTSLDKIFILRYTTVLLV